jgi:hypothetical protein
MLKGCQAFRRGEALRKQLVKTAEVLVIPEGTIGGNVSFEGPWLTHQHHGVMVRKTRVMGHIWDLE